MTKPIYQIKPGEPNTPLYEVWKDGVKHREFTSRIAAQGWLEHVLEHGEQTRLKPAVIVAGRGVSVEFKSRLADRLNGFFK